MIPRRDTFWAAIVEAPKPYGEVVDPWDQNPCGQNLSPARQLAVNGVQKVRVSPAQLLTGHKLWATLDYASVEHPDVRGNLEWAVERAGTGHGIVVWFDADLVEGVGFSNAPGAPETVYGSLLFPWSQSAPLERNQIVCMGP
jgi:type I protein arginine methyltransferase